MIKIIELVMWIQPGVNQSTSVRVRVMPVFGSAQLLERVVCAHDVNNRGDNFLLQMVPIVVLDHQQGVECTDISVLIQLLVDESPIFVAWKYVALTQVLVFAEAVDIQRLLRLVHSEHR